MTFTLHKKTGLESPPSSYAIAAGASDVVRLLVDNNADPNLADSSGKTPFMTAVRTDSPELINLLLEHGLMSTQAPKQA